MKTLVPTLDVPAPIDRPLDATEPAYLLSNADRPATAVAVSGALVRSLLASTLHSGGAAALDPGDGEVVLSWPQIGGMVPALLGPVFRAVPCARPPRTPCCARCGHWPSEHDHPAVPTSCTRYRLNIRPARFKLPDHPGVTYAWVRRFGRTRVVFEIAEPSALFPGGTLAVHRYPAVGDGPVEFSAHFHVIPEVRRAALLRRAAARVR
ncbi:hypothetical protein ABT024_05120 [Streptomyces sp. NPDC002812]|uniref:hypothetical protein n=1 Tax=Streptomyces sp. NPDC002812 TaxID=3154434 RepID=UPI00331C35FA